MYKPSVKKKTPEVIHRLTLYAFGLIFKVAHKYNFGYYYLLFLFCQPGIMYPKSYVVQYYIEACQSNIIHLLSNASRNHIPFNSMAFILFFFFSFLFSCGCCKDFYLLCFYPKLKHQTNIIHTIIHTNLHSVKYILFNGKKSVKVLRY